MKKIDVLFSDSEMAEIQNMVGKKMLKYKCDPFEFSTSVYGIIGVSLEDADYAFTNMVMLWITMGIKRMLLCLKLSEDRSPVLSH